MQKNSSKTTTQHTQGPWEIRRTDDCRLMIYADAPGQQRNGSPIAVIDGTTSDEESANARLIAAAPELLHCLKQIELIASINGPAFRDGCKMHQLMKKLIARAEGRE